MSARSVFLLLRKIDPLALLGVVSQRSIFKLVLAAYFLFEILPNDVTRRCTAAGATFDSENESKELINGKVIRVLVFNVNNKLLAGLLKIIALHSLLKFSLKFKNCIIFWIKYSSAMIITQLQDGTMQYRGIVFDMLDYFSKALNIR